MRKFYLLIFLVINTFVYCQQIKILSPRDGQFIPIDQWNNLFIRWDGPKRLFVKIEYTLDGKNWIQFPDSLPGSDTSHYLKPPDSLHINTDQFKVRITDVTDPKNFDENKIPATIYIVRYEPTLMNRVKMWIGNNSDGSHDINNSWSGFYWPAVPNSYKAAVFEDGLMWGGLVNGNLHVNGNYYRSGLTPGRINNINKPINPADSMIRIYRIRKNWDNMLDDSLKNIIKNNIQYWPVKSGALWYDNNKDGQYTPGIDNPILLGDEDLFYVANDLDTIQSENMFDTGPIGLELQCITYSYDSTDFLGDAVFKRYLLINKSSNTISDMYFSYWTDDDLGSAEDDYIGCDSALNLGFTWNADNDDITYGSPPPAVGHMLLQGPLVKSTSTDSAMFKGEWKPGYKNLSISSFTPGFKANTRMMLSDPPLSEFEGAQNVYNFMQGLNKLSEGITNPLTNEVTKFPLSGDPETGSGWYEGDGWPGGLGAGDRRFYLNSGLFEFAPGDTQEVVIAIFAAQGTSNKNSVTLLKNNAELIKNFYKNNFQNRYTALPYSSPKIVPNEYSISQNFPNPFNSTTTIRVKIPQNVRISIVLYDILGRKIKTLTDKIKEAGTYNLRYNLGSLSSGIYFYRVEAGDFIQTKKMVLMK